VYIIRRTQPADDNTRRENDCQTLSHRLTYIAYTPPSVEIGPTPLARTG